MTFFVNVAAKLKEPISTTNHDKLKDYCQSKISEDTKFTIPNIKKEKVFKLHGPPMLVDKTNFGLVIYNNANFYRFEELSSYWSVKRKSVFL